MGQQLLRYEQRSGHQACSLQLVLQAHECGDVQQQRLRGLLCAEGPAMLQQAQQASSHGCRETASSLHMQLHMADLEGDWLHLLRMIAV